MQIFFENLDGNVFDRNILWDFLMGIFQDIWETFWSLTKTNITEENQEILCHRENHEIYIGLARKRNYQEAFRICRSFGGHLPTPIR